MLLAAESICGEYVWGIYDLIVLPPSFPYGGMENPCLTFVTPTLLVSMLDLSNLLVICIQCLSLLQIELHAVNTFSTYFLLNPASF
jgi:hypothetical protein